MDLKKLDPSARKMRLHMDAFYKALDENDSFNAREHIGEILKYADNLSQDIDTAIIKSTARPTNGINDIYAGGAPVRKFKEVNTIHSPSTQVLPGTIRTSRSGPIMQQRNNRNF